MKKVIFLSHIINKSTPIYGGEKSIAIKKIKSIKQGDSCNKTYWSFSAHTGTHIDAPKHFLDKGRSVSGLMAGELFFNKIALAVLKGVKPGYVITESDLGKLRDCELLLLKTGFEKHRNKAVYWKDSPALNDSLAAALKKACPSIRAVGVDFISISNLKNRESGRLAHKAFLGNGIFLIEDMKLKSLRAVPDFIVIAPLLLDNADAAPCTILGVYN